MHLRPLAHLSAALCSLALLPACQTPADPPSVGAMPSASAPAPPAPAPQCNEARWDVPSVPRADLDKHDLAWVGCGFTACGPLEGQASAGEPAPGKSITCQAPSLDPTKLAYLGHIHPNQSGAFTTSDVISPSNIAWLDGARHIYRYREAVYLLTEADEAADQLDVFYMVRALEVLRTAYPSVFDRLLVQTADFPSEPTVSGRGWKNRFRSFVLSFDASPQYIAAGITVLDAAPKKNATTGLDEYSNVAAISIDRENILGKAESVGSRPLYGKPSADEDFLRYLREGLVETLVHELLHRYIDRLNSVDDRMNELFTRRSAQGACEVDALEETLVASASLGFFRQAGGLGKGYLDYYDKVLDDNRSRIGACPEFSRWSAQFSKPSSVAPRYEMRLVDLK